MSDTHNNNQRRAVVACIDGSTYSQSVSDYARWLCTGLHAPFLALHAIEHNSVAAVSDFTGAIGLGAQEQLLSELTEVEQQRNKLEIERGKDMLNATRQRVLSLEPVVEFDSTQRHGPLVETLIDLEEQTRLVVLGIRGEAHEPESKQFGAHIESIVRSVQRPILVVNNEFSEPKQTMLAYDGSPCCQKALQMIVDSDVFTSVPVHVVHVADDVAKGEALVAEAATTLALAKREVQTAVLHGKREDALCEYQLKHDIGLTVMGAFSHNRLREFVFGSFTAKMLLNTQRPLLLLR